MTSQIHCLMKEQSGLKQILLEEITELFKAKNLKIEKLS